MDNSKVFSLWLHNGQNQVVHSWECSIILSVHLFHVQFPHLHSNVYAWVEDGAKWGLKIIVVYWVLINFKFQDKPNLVMVANVLCSEFELLIICLFCCCLVSKSCLTLCDLMDCSLPGSSVHGIFQARILDWVAISFFNGSSQPRNQTLSYELAGRFFTTEAPEKPPIIILNQFHEAYWLINFLFLLSLILWLCYLREMSQGCFLFLILWNSLWNIEVICFLIPGSLLDSKEIKPVNSKRIQPWIFIGRLDDEAEAPILWPPDARSQLIGKDLDNGKDWRQEEKEATEDEMVGWHHWLNGHEFQQILGDSEGQGSLVCCSP